MSKDNKTRSKLVERAIVFTDIESSSELWSSHDQTFVMHILNKHNDIIRDIAKLFKGKLLKTSGDSCMLSFRQWKSAFRFCLHYQQCMEQMPIWIDEQFTKRLKVRVGFCYGQVTKQYHLIQNNWLVDYFGSAVNKASRMESKVSTTNGFAFCFHGNKKDPKHLENLDPKIQYQIEMVHFRNDCSNQVTRSQKVLNTIQQHCHSASDLKGVGEVTAYKVTLVNTPKVVEPPTLTPNPEIVYTEPPKDIIKDNIKKLKKLSRRKRSPSPLAKRTPSTFRQVDPEQRVSQSQKEPIPERMVPEPKQKQK